LLLSEQMPLELDSFQMWPTPLEIYVNRLYISFQKTPLEMISRGGHLMPTVSQIRFLPGWAVRLPAYNISRDKLLTAMEIKDGVSQNCF